MQDYYEVWVVKNISVSTRVTLCNSTDSTITLVLHCVQPDGYETFTHSTNDDPLR